MINTTFFISRNRQKYKDRLSTIIENSVEFSMFLSQKQNQLAKKVANFEEVSRDFIFKYLHEKEICEFFEFVAAALKQTISDINIEICLFFLMKFLLIRLNLLKNELKKKTNLFGIDFWSELTSSSLYDSVFAAIVENEVTFNKMFKEFYGMACKGKNSEGVLSKEEGKFINENKGMII